MVICFFSTQYPPTPGGVERYTWNLARRCVAAGHRALVVTASLPGLPARERDADGIEIYRLPSWPVMGGRFPVLKPFADADDLWAQGIDFAVIQTRMYTQSVWAARQCKRRGIPALVIDHSTGYMLHGGLAGARGKAYEHAACGSIRRCGFLFYGVSGDVCRWLKTFGIQAAGRLPNAVDPAELERLAHADNAVDWRRRLNVPAGGRLVAFVGRLIPEKGALRLAQAVQGIPGCTLAVAGTGPEEAALAALGGVDGCCHKGIRVPDLLPHQHRIPRRYRRGTGCADVHTHGNTHQFRQGQRNRGTVLCVFMVCQPHTMQFLHRIQLLSLFRVALHDISTEMKWFL